MKELKPEDFGMTEAEAKDIKDFAPTLNLSDLDKETPNIKVKVISEKPESITYRSKETGEEESAKVLKVLNVETKTENTLWLSATSLRREIFRVFAIAGKLKDLVLIISVREYKHKKYGETRAYSVTVVKE